MSKNRLNETKFNEMETADTRIRIGKRVILLVMGFVLCLSGVSASAQQKAAKGTLSGKVVDVASSEALPYVNVALLAPKDSTLVGGIITSDDGTFVLANISQGNYILRCSFIGYKDYFSSVKVNSGKTNLGTILLTASSETLEGVEVVAERQMMEYKLDKRVVNVDKNLVSAGGSASDVLENVPSVSVDEDGEVSLRGNSNVKVLIDGKPSELLGNDLASVLSQIPASSIENVEVITNPSAKYDPEGMSGIINIKLKQKGGMGLTGTVNISAGSSLEKFMPRTNGSASVSYSTNKFGFSASIDGRYNERGRRGDNLKLLFPKQGENLEAFMRSKRDGLEKGGSGGVKLGFDWYINSKNTLTLSYNGRFHSTPSDSNLISNVNLFDQNITDPTLLSRRSLDQTTLGTHDGQFHTFSLNYQKKFANPDQELTVDASWNMGSFNREMTQYIDYLNPTYDNDYAFDMRDKSTEDNNRAVLTVNYSHPFSKNLRMETGYDLKYSGRNSVYQYYYYGAQTPDPTSYDFTSDEFIHALYATLGYSYGKWSGQLGLRGEVVRSTASKTSASSDKTSFDKNYTSPFPTLHLSYQISETQSAQLSYSRRINRPSMFTMMPNVDWSNPEQIRFGNPDINPEYTDAIEIGYSHIFPKTVVFASAYYRQTNDKISWFNFLWTEQNARYYGFDWVLDVAGDEVDKGRIAMTSLNIDKSSNYGVELIIDQQITKWWKVNLSANLFGSHTGTSIVNSKEINSFNWDAKLNSTMNLPKSWTIQISAQYSAPRKTIQGESAAFFFSDIAIKKSLNKKATLSLRYTDVFRTMKRQNTSITEDYYSFNIGRPYRMAISLNFSYRFGGNDMAKPKTRSTNRLDRGQGSETGGGESEE